MDEYVSNVGEILKGWPRPHYLSDGAFYAHEGDLYSLSGKVLFPLSDLSIGDRMRVTRLKVNVANAEFGVWNAIHIISSMGSFRDPLATGGTFRAFRPILADTFMDLDVKLSLTGERKGRRVLASYKAVYAWGDKVFMELEGEGVLTSIENSS